MYTRKRGFIVVLGATRSGLSLFLLLAAQPVAAASDAGGLCQSDVTPDAPAEPADEIVTAPNCRYGVSASKADYMGNLNAGWAVTFAPTAAWLPAGVDHAATIRLKQVKNGSTRLQEYTTSPELTDAALGKMISDNPGGLWIVGNEPDRSGWQDDIMPDMYAVAYHGVYEFIKQRDPTARVAFAGLVQVTPGRLQYMDIAWNTYKEKYGGAMPVDAWTFHAYIFPERTENGQNVFAYPALGTDLDLAIKYLDPTISIPSQLSKCSRDDYYCIYEHDDISLFAKQVVDLRRWMKEHGQQNKPLILTEYSLLYAYQVNPDGSCEAKDEKGNCFTPQRVTEFMENANAYLENTRNEELGYPLDDYRLVQQWAWFSLDDFGGERGMDVNPSVLINRSGVGLAMMGQKYQQLIAQQPISQSLIIEGVNSSAVSTSPTTKAASAKLSVKIRNNGNTATTQPFVVNFYEDAAKTKLIGSTTVPAGLGGCATDMAVAEVSWDIIEAGVHPFFVEADATGTIPGGSVEDKSAEGAVIVDAKNVFLPAALR